MNISKRLSPTALLTWKDKKWQLSFVPFAAYNVFSVHFKFHSDSEIGLGPFVAGLSLGAPAMMHFRLHAKHDPERKHRRTAISFILRHVSLL